jgi:cysteinyl-tRNA synthetase
MPDYGILRGGKTTRDENHTRVAENPEKKNPEDFALWKFNSKIGFKSIWGKGFPGWHIECSAIGIKFLGDQFDIHTGGIDLIPTHHTNEIAQSESVTGKKPFVKFWIHSEFVDIGSEKMSKSKNNFLKLSNVSEKGMDPITYRFWLLMASHHTKVNFNWEALEGAETALKRLYGLYLELENEPSPQLAGKHGHIHKEYQNKFKEYLEDDLDTPRALSLLWDVLKDPNMSNSDKKATVLDFDKVLGLGFGNLKKEIIPEEIMALAHERERARENKDFKKSDELRKEINSLGYEVNDMGSGYKINKI